MYGESFGDGATGSMPLTRRKLRVTASTAAAIVLAFAIVLVGPVQAQTPSGSPNEPASTIPGPLVTPATPAPVLSEDVSAALNQLTTRIDTVEKSVERLKDRPHELAAQRGEIETILEQSQRLSEALRPRLSQFQSQMQKLGDAPDKDKASEPAAVASERARLLAEAGLYEGAIKTAELVQTRASQLVARVQEYRYAFFARHLLQQQISPLRSALWRELAADVQPVARQMSSLAKWWMQGARNRALELLALAVAAPLLYLWLRRATRRLLLPRGAPLATPPAYLRRSKALLRNWPLLSMPLGATAIALFVCLIVLDLVPAPIDGVALAILKGVLLYAAASALATCLLAPRNPAWRVIPLADASARRITSLIVWGTIVAGVDLALSGIARALFLPVSIPLAQVVIANIVFAGLLIAILHTPWTAPSVDSEGGELSPDRYAPYWLKLPLWAVTVGIIVATMIGYVALAQFTLRQVALIALASLVVWLVHLAIKALAADPAGDPQSVGNVLETRLGLDAARRSQLASLTALVLNVLLVTIAVPLLLLQWGFSSTDILDWVKAAVFGFEIGQFKISLARILLAIALFTALLFVTRLAQGWLGRNVLTPSRMDPGIANSVHTAIGYVGVGLSLLIALSYGGLDITNLAIVAGALSVGIGFGLQSIVLPYSLLYWFLLLDTFQHY